MKKNKWSKVAWLFLGLVPLLLIACGGNVTPTAVAPTTASPATEASAVPVIEAVEEEPMMVGTAISDEIMPVSAKPQLIEFYADW